VNLDVNDAIIMKWTMDEYQINAPLDSRKHRNVAVIRSIPGINSYITSCKALDLEYIRHKHIQLQDVWRKNQIQR
jgi:hypothetical protein